MRSSKESVIEEQSNSSVIEEQSSSSKLADRRVIHQIFLVIVATSTTGLCRKDRGQE